MTRSNTTPELKLFDPAAWEIVFKASSVKSSRSPTGYATASTAHLLFRMLFVNSAVGAYLIEKGVTPRKVQSQIETVVVENDQSVDIEDIASAFRAGISPYYTPVACRVLWVAHDIAKENGKKSINIAHILLAILRSEPHNAAVKILGELGVNIDEAIDMAKCTT